MRLEYKWLVLTVTTIGAFMASLDSSIIVVGLPTVVEQLNTSVFLGIWMITGYRLMITVLLVAIGRIADMVGRIKLYNAGFAIFTVGSVLCAVSQTAEMLIAFRLVQGFGAALLIVNSVAIVVDAFQAGELGTAIGIHQMAINAGTIAGYTLSGVMISLFGWRSMFWINIPVGIFGTVWAHRCLNELHVKLERQRLDYVGAILFSAAITLMLIALTAADPDSLLTRVCLIVSAVSFAAFLLFERRAEQPVIDLTLFKIRLYAAGNLSNLCNSLSFNAVAFGLTLYFQLVRGYGAFEAGLALVPMEITLIATSPIGGRLSDRYGARGLSTLGLGLTSLALLLFATFSADTSLAFISVALALAGFGIGLFRSPNASSVMGSVPPERRGIAAAVRSTMLNTSHVLSIPLGLTLMSVLMPYDSLAAAVSATALGGQEIVMLQDAIRFSFFGLAIINGVGVAISALRGPKSAPVAVAPRLP